MGLLSDLVQYVRDNIWPSGPQSLPSFTAEAQAFSERDSWRRMMDEGIRQMKSYREYEVPVIETVSSDSVFDIFNVDSDYFWYHHGNEKADYMELVSHLPEIQERLANGESLDSIRSIPHLSNTVEEYYSDNKMPKVIKCEDGYRFQGDGRHRMMAAKEMGYDVTVKVVGEEETEEEDVEVTVDNTKAAEEAEKEAEEEKARLEKALEEEETKQEKEMEEEEIRAEKELEEEEAEAEKEAEAGEEEAEKEAEAEEEEAEKEAEAEAQEVGEEVKEETGNGPEEGEDLDGGMEY